MFCFGWGVVVDIKKNNQLCFLILKPFAKLLLLGWQSKGETLVTLETHLSKHS